VHRRDAYEALKAFLPPKENRGLVVVDPPYEAVDEFEQVAKAVIAGHRRWPGGRWLIWHPVKERAPVWRLEEALIAGGVGKMLSVELLVRPVDGVSLAGSGLILVNPPFGLEPWLAEALPQMQKALAPEHGSHALRWLGSP
jgi:23S rRNA (adenine2030-N6)-methyltransferase